MVGFVQLLLVLPNAHDSSKKRPHKVNLTCYAGHFLLTDLLLEKIKVTAKESSIEGRVVIVASDSYKHPYREGFRFDKINDESGYCFLTQITDSSFFLHVHYFQHVL